MLSSAVVLLLSALVLQCFAVVERVLYHSLCLMIHGRRPALKELTDKGLLAAFASAVSELVAVALSVVLACVHTALRNVAVVSALMAAGALVFVLAGSGNTLFALAVNLYNGGVGVFIDAAIIKPIQLGHIVLSPLIVAYNGVTWFASQLVVQVLMPTLRLNVNILPDLLQSLSQSGAALSLSTATLFARVAECSTLRPLDGTSSASGTVNITLNVTEHTVPFTDPNMHCVANANYLRLDLLTVGAFLRKAADAMFLLLTSSCSALTPILEVVWYPTLDYNLYASINSAVNSVLSLLLAPVKTWRRCEYASRPGLDFTALEKFVMCVPDVMEVRQNAVASILSLGKLLDNWLDVLLHVAETHSAVSGGAPVCQQQVLPVLAMRANVSQLGSLGRGMPGTGATRAQRVVGLQQMLALTDGDSTVFWTGQHTIYGVEHWPVLVDATLGVAAVSFYDGDARTALLGCRCEDGENGAGMQIVCVSTPFSSDSLNRTLHRVQFEASDMTCQTTLIHVQALRFDRGRYSASVRRGYDTAHGVVGDDTAGRTEQLNVADALIYVQPLCALESAAIQVSCLPQARNCFPYCMGVHIAGRHNAVIRLHNAREWRESVQYRETDCAVARNEATCAHVSGGVASADGLVVVDVPSMSANGTENLVVQYTSTCLFDGAQCIDEPSAVTFRRMAASNVETRNVYSAPVLTLQEQPVVVAGDVMIFQQATDPDTGIGALTVSRLRHYHRGMRQETLTTAENKATFAYGTCTNAADAICAEKMLAQGRVLLPPTYQVDRAPRPAVGSRWAVHWAVNLELAVLDSAVAVCKGGTATSLTVWSSLGTPRVWTLKTNRAVYAMGLDTSQNVDNGVSFFELPNAVSRETPCHAVVNFEVDSMEYLDDSNILVTTKASSLASWPQNFEYRHYYLHPNRHDCYASDGSEAIFSCWRSESSGPFLEDSGQAPLIAGQLCPALQRMPKLGSVGAHSIAGGTVTLNLIVQAMLLLPALLVRGQDIGAIFERRDKYTYHSVLDSAGYELLNVDEILLHVERSLMFQWQTLAKLAEMWNGKFGDDVVESFLLGTAKIKQFAYSDSTLFQDPVLQKLQQVSAAPTGKLIDSVQKMLVSNPINLPGFTGSKPTFVSAIQGLATQFTSSLKLNARLICRNIRLWASKINNERRILQKAEDLREPLSIMDVGGHFSSELREEVPLSYTSIMREQCEGMALIIGHSNPWARTVRHACMLTPSAIEMSVDVLAILLSDYPAVACACKVTEDQQNADTTTCLVDRVRSLSAAAWTKNLPSDLSQQQATCFRTMDVVNWRLEHASDELFARMQMLIDSMPASMDHVTSFFDSGGGQCVEQSPYVVSILPDPVDYFMECSGTSACRARCLDNFVAFEGALARTTTAPNFQRKSSVSVQSKFFSLQDIEEQLHLPPFDIRALAPAVLHYDRKCGNRLFVVGILDAVLQRREYCVPRDIASFVREVGTATQYSVALGGVLEQVELVVAQAVQPASTQTPAEAPETSTAAGISDVHLNEVRANAGVLVLSTTPSNQQIVQFAWPRLAITLLETRLWNPRLYEHTAQPGDPGFVLQRVLRVRGVAVSSSAGNDMAGAFIAYVVGSRMVSTTAGRSYSVDGLRFTSNYEMRQVCVRLDIPPLRFADTRSVQWSFCEDDVLPADVAIVCLSHACEHEILLPRVRGVNVTQRHVLHAESGKVNSSRSLPTASSLSKTLGLRLPRALYLTGSGTAAENIRRIAPVAVGVSADAAADMTASLVVRVFLSGLPTQTGSSAETWLQMAEVALDPHTLTDGSVRTSQSTTIEMQTVVPCSIDNCMGCQSSVPSQVFADLQLKCMAAQQCALAKCVGTRVNLARPLCNIGAVLSKNMDLMASGTRATWLALVRQIILIVELSAERRKVYEISWPEEAFVDLMCTAKDSVVESASIVSSIFGGAALTQTQPTTTVQIRSTMSESRWQAKYFMSLQAITRLLSSIAMMPLYAAIALQKTVTCTTNDIIVSISGIISPDNAVSVTIGNAQMQQNLQSSGVVSLCLSALVAERLRDAAVDAEHTASLGGNSLVHGEVVAVVREVSDLARRIPLEPISHALDASITYTLGLVNGVMDVAQSIDFDRCKLPDIMHARIDACVCQDTPVRIPHQHRHGSPLWCTGPLLLTMPDGSEQLVWNPYSFAELLAPDDMFEDYLQCMASSVECDIRPWHSELRTKQPASATLAQVIELVRELQHSQSEDGATDADRVSTIRCVLGCEMFKPTLSQLTRQGVDVMHVISRCRANYQAKQWDEGAALLGLFDMEQWGQLSTAPLGQDSFTRKRVQLRALREVINSRAFPATKSIVDCMNMNLAQSDAVEHCTQQEIQQDSTDLAAYFAYETNSADSAPHRFVRVDACESFSGSVMGQFSQNLSLPLFMWAGSSSNSEPVASYHNKRGGTDRVATAESEFALLLANIQADIESLESTPLQELDVEAVVREGDIVHQFVDCVVLGPFAAADMHVAPYSQGMTNILNEQKYHRGQAGSREFMGGSPARRKIVHEVEKHVSSVMSDVVKAAAEQQYTRIQSLWRDESKLKCLCPGSDASNLACCLNYESVADIRYQAQDAIQFNMQDDVLDKILQEIGSTDILRGEIWQSHDFVSPPTQPSVDDMYILRDNGLFVTTDNRILSYDIDEVADADGNRTNQPLWHECMDMLSRAFFTMPLHNQALPEHLQRAVRNFNPGKDSADEWLHAQEGIIAQLLNESRHTVPVFWTHQHRYVPSDSTWCEDLSASPTPQTTINTIKTGNSLQGNALTRQTLLAPRLDQVEFPGSANMCVCGQESTMKCQFAGYVHVIKNECIKRVKIKNSTHVVVDLGQGHASQNGFWRRGCDRSSDQCSPSFLYDEYCYNEGEGCQMFISMQNKGIQDTFLGFPFPDVVDEDVLYDDILDIQWVPENYELTRCKSQEQGGYVTNVYRKRVAADDLDLSLCHDDARCAVPSFSEDLDMSGNPTLNARWQTLKKRGWYTSREDMYTLLEVMQVHGDADVYAQCQPPSVTWGLLARDSRADWYKGEETSSLQASLQDIATHGPSGVRLRMLKAKNGLSTEMHDNILYDTDSNNPAYNFAHQHSIAQPYCNSTLSQMFDKSIREHLSDVLFPMAHSVHVSPVSAYCTTWAVEHGMMSMLAAHLPATDVRLSDQRALEKSARARCYVQLEQMGMCMLRGVFEMPPPPDLPPPNCNYDPTTDASVLACVEQWVLPNCLLACKHSTVADEQSLVQFYDVELCKRRFPDEVIVDCQPLAFDPRPYADTEQVKLHSMHWPDTISARETTHGDPQLLSRLADAIRLYKAETGFDTAGLMPAVRAALLAHDSAVEEGGPPDSFCDDLFDWYPADAQHPVGYHPSTTFDSIDTMTRGFDSWMSGYSAPVDGASTGSDYSVDFRVFNSTTRSQFFGAAALVCDARLYGKLLRQPKSYYIDTQWDSRSAFDAGIPGASPPHISPNTAGLNEEQSAAHSPLLDALDELSREMAELDTVVQNTQSTDYIEHRAGLIRNWPICGDAAGNALWPLWTTGERNGWYGMPSRTTRPETCSEHPLLTCTTVGGASGDQGTCEAGLVCLHVSDEQDNPNDEPTGICAGADTCFAHFHCAAQNKLCAGDGRCAEPSIVINNKLGAEIQVQVFAQAGQLSSYSLSEYQQVPDFAHEHGQCSLENWQRYSSQLDSTDPVDSCAQPDAMQRACGLMHHVVHEADSSALEQQAHPCDATWQHTSYSVVDLREATLHAGTGGALDSGEHNVAYMRTRHINTLDGSRMLRLCPLSQRSNTGIINPYSYYNASTHLYDDTLDNIPQTVQRCSLFDICPVMQFDVQFATVSSRLALAVAREERPSSRQNGFITTSPNIHVRYRAEDSFECGAVGQSTGAHTCVVDQLVLPLAAVVYNMAGLDRPLTQASPLAQYNQAPLSLAKMQVQHNCPSALDSIWTTLHDRIMYEYKPSQASVVTWAANTLLPAIFGLQFHTTDGYMQKPAEWDLDQYLQHTRCAQWLHSELETLRDWLPDMYSADPRVNMVQPGTSLYVFQHHAPVPLPFAWFWQCVLLNSNANLHVDWLVHISNSTPSGDRPANRDNTYSQQCSIQRAPQNTASKVTVRQRLRMASFFFEQETSIDAHIVAQLAKDVDSALARGLDELGLPEFAGLTEMHRNEDCDLNSPDANFFPTQALLTGHLSGASDKAVACWTKSGRDSSTTVLADNAVQQIVSGTTDNPLLGTGLRARARQHLFGVTTHSDLMNKNLDQLQEYIAVLNDIDDMHVDSNATFIPRLKFLQTYSDFSVADLIIKQSSTTSAQIEHSNGVYATQDNTDSNLYILAVPEYHRYKPPRRRGQLQAPHNYSPYLREDNAVQELLEWFYADIRTTATFRSENLFRSAQDVPDWQQIRSDDSLSFRSAAIYNTNIARMGASFKCSDSNELDEARATNEAHAELQMCVSKMQHIAAKRMPQQSTMKVGVTPQTFLQGFYPAYSEHSVKEDTAEARHFLTKLFSPSVVYDTQDNFCFTNLRTGKAEVLNPLWSGLFDLVSGCDLEVVGSGPAQYHRIRASPSQPAHCAARSLETVAFAQNGTLGRGFTPLCERRPSAASVCHRRRGALGGRLGASLLDLKDCPECVVNEQGDMFGNSADNVYNPSARFDPTNDPSTLSMRYKTRHIGGHVIHFDVRESGTLSTSCVQLSREDLDTCRDWLRDIQQVWQHEHTAPNDTPPDNTQPWTCPLMLVDQWSTPQRAHYPNIARNSYRFGHSTGQFYGIHPTVASRYKVKSLHPARFMSEAQMCMGHRGDRCEGDLSKAIETLLSNSFHTVNVMQSDRAVCNDIVDWPHKSFVLRDGGAVDADEKGQSDTCFVQNRLPAFDVRLTAQTIQPAVRMNSVTPNGPCHMGRLRRLQAPQSNSNKFYEDCKPTDGGILCRYTDTSAVPYTMHETIYLETSSAPSVAPARRYQHCSNAFMRTRRALPKYIMHQGPVPKDINDTLLSRGIPMQMRPARKIAAHIRTLLCPSAAEPCDAVAHWDSIDTFLATMLAHSDNDGTASGSGTGSSSGTAPPDTELWARPWLFCEDDAPCVGNINKDLWLDPATRQAQCMLGLQNTPHTSQATVDFCLLDNNTAALCNFVAQWKQELEGILCRAAGAAECPQAGFFYSPTTYSLSNREFVYDTVDSFYKLTYPSAHSSTCAHTSGGVSAAAQAASNEALKAQCASTALAPVKTMLLELRQLKTLLVESIYYISCIAAEFMNLLISATISSAQTLQSVGNRLLMYIGMLFAIWAEVMQQLYRVVFAIIFRDGMPALVVEFIEALCGFANWIIRNIIGTSADSGVLCRVFNMLGNVLQEFAGTLETIPLVDLTTVSGFLNNTGLFMRTVLPCTEDILMECDFSDAVDTAPVTGALPVATRCVSTYQTFFGDNTPLSCTHADTCRAALLSTDLVACALCPDAVAGYDDFGCEPHTKLCTCQVQRLEKTTCRTNEDCLFAPTCKYTDRFLQEAVGFTPCSQCVNERFCMQHNANEEGHCACSLTKAQYSTCDADYLGMSVHVHSDSLCLLDRATQLAVTAQVSVAWQSVATTPCNRVQPSTVYCMQILDTTGGVTGTYAVAHSTVQTFGRRLLWRQDDANARHTPTTQPLSHLSLNAACRDAANSPATFAATLLACESACVDSMYTVRDFNLSAANTTFCSLEDLAAAIHSNPMLPFHIFSREGAVAAIIARHSWMRHAVQYWHALLTFLDTMLHEQQHTRHVRGAMQGKMQPQRNSSIASSSKRRLLQAYADDDTADTTSRASSQREERLDLLDTYALFFEDVHDLHDSYASKLGTAYESAYPHLSQEAQPIWMEEWPPRYMTTAQSTGAVCRPLVRTVELAREAANASMRHFQVEIAMPSIMLTTSWPTLPPLDSNKTNIFTRPVFEDWLLDGFAWLTEQTLAIFDIARSDPSRALESILHAMYNNVKCDLQQLQTCSGWRARIPNAIIMAVVFYSAWFAICRQLGLGVLAMLTLALFPSLVLFLAYDYSPLCVPLIPPCLLLDVYTSLEALLPVYIDLPVAFYKNESCAHLSTVDARCLYSCSDPPWMYNDWSGPLTWALAEVGAGATDFVLSILAVVPLIDLEPLRTDIRVKLSVLTQGDEDSIFVHRVCALSSLYMLLPYFILAVVLLFSALSTGIACTRLIRPMTDLLCAIITAASTT